VGNYLWLIPAFPLLAAGVIAFFGPRFLRGASHWPCVAAAGVSCLLSLRVLAAVAQLAPYDENAVAGPHVAIERYYDWVRVGDVNLGLTLRADGLSAIMLATVTFIGTLIAIFSIGYMRDDPGYPRFFAEVSLFIAAMTLLVLADNFLVLYAGWEGVGLCSYLLIGFWFQKPAAADAARKAFLVTRLGDMGLLLGIILLWVKSEFALDFGTVFRVMSTPENHYYVGAACLLIFCGCVGKSAQFPLHVWLPDAMEGPSPVSALIHAATMVTAGVYLVARCTPLFVQVPAVQLVVAAVGCFTALLGALIALTQNDLKRVLAYSTISQLGYMFLGLGSGAVVAGVFHLFTHAFFKALLFLAAGSVMHAMGGVIDMRRFSGLKKLMPWTHWTFLAGALALAGFPGFSGFWSKDEIIAGTLQRSEVSGWYGMGYLVLFVVALVTAGLTAFYTFRAYLKTFEGEERIPEEAGHHAHESPRVMTIPLAILAAGAVLVGLIEPVTHGFSRMLREHTVGISDLAEQQADFAVMVLSSLVAVGGILAAVFVYRLRTGLADHLAQKAPALYQLSLNKFGLDEVYQLFVVMPFEWIATLCRYFDIYVIDKLVDILGLVPRLLGGLFRPVQNGLVQFYALAMILGLAVFLLALVSKL